MLQSIKEDRRLSFKHWRYRLLHWCFNVKNPDQKNLYATGMPSFLYTHYCPLFHITNLIALLSPVILLLKLITLLVKALIIAFGNIPCEWLFDLLDAFLAIIKPAKTKTVPVSSKNDERKMFLKYLVDWEGDFLSIWNRFEFTLLSKEEGEAIYNEYYPQILALREKAKTRREIMRERLVFWTNFSRVFIKWGLNIFYFCLTLVVLYIGYLITFPVISVIAWLFSIIIWLLTDIGSLTMFFFVCKVAFFSFLFVSFCFLTLRFGIVQKFCETCLQGLSYLKPPLYLFTTFGCWISSGFNGIKDFVAMFYEENCPPIILISEEEAIIAKEEEV